MLSNHSCTTTMEKHVPSFFTFLNINSNKSLHTILILLLTVVHNCLAEEQSNTKKELPILELGIGIGVTTLADYRGSDETRTLYLPIPYINYRGDKVKVDRRGIRGILYESENTAINVSGGFGLGVNSSKNKARVGMPDLDPALQLGPSFEYLIDDDNETNSTTLFKFPVKLVVATNFLDDWHSEGVLFTPHINYVRETTWHFGLSVGLTFASQSYNDYYYSVAPQFSNTERAAYTAKSGYNGAYLAMSLTKRFDTYWIGSFLRYDNLNGATFEDSPLVKQNHALLVGVGISYIMTTFYDD